MAISLSHDLAFKERKMKIRPPFVYAFLIVFGIFLWQGILMPNSPAPDEQDVMEAQATNQTVQVDEKKLMQHLREGLEAQKVQLVHYESEPECLIEVTGEGEALVSFVKYLEKHLPYSLESVTLDYKANHKGHMIITI